jgi:hypothetical protein
MTVTPLTVTSKKFAEWRVYLVERLIKHQHRSVIVGLCQWISGRKRLAARLRCCWEHSKNAKAALERYVKGA